MTKVTDELTKANYASSIFKSNTRLKEFFCLTPSLRKDEDAIICRSFFSTEFMLNLSTNIGVTFSRLQLIHKLLLFDDGGVFMWVKVLDLLTFDEQEKDAIAVKDNKPDDKMPLDAKVYLMNLKSFQNFCETDVAVN